MAVLDPLNEVALIDILVRPKNAITKQYQKLFNFEGIDLKFTESALKAIAQTAIKRRTGARGLRAVLETSMLDIMFDVPSKVNVKEVLIDENVINLKSQPELIFKSEEEIKNTKLSDPAESA